MENTGVACFQQKCMKPWSEIKKTFGELKLFFLQSISSYFLLKY